MKVITVTEARVVAFFMSISVAPIASPSPCVLSIILFSCSLNLSLSSAVKKRERMSYRWKEERTWAATMQRKTVSMLRKKGPALSLKPAIKYTTRRKSMGSNRSSGRSLVVLARKYALNLYMSAARSLVSMALSWGNAKMAVKTGKNPQNTAMKNNSPACMWDWGDNLGHNQVRDN